MPNNQYKRLLKQQLTLFSLANTPLLYGGVVYSEVLNYQEHLDFLPSLRVGFIQSFDGITAFERLCLGYLDSHREWCQYN